MPNIKNPYLSFFADDVKIVERKTVYNGFAKVEQVTLQHRLFEDRQFSKPILRELVKRPEAAGVLLYDSKQQLFGLIEQFRIGAIDSEQSAWQLEIVAGLVEDGDTPEQTVIREAVEEAGVYIKTPQLLYSFYPSAGGCNELFHLYVADTQLSHTNQIFGALGEAENIKLHVLKYAQLAALLSNPQYLKNGPVVIALQWLTLQLKTE